MSSKTTKKVYLLIVLTLLINIGGNAKADFIFGTPTNLGSTVNSTACENAPSISTDGLELYFADHGGSPLRPGGYGGGDLWVTIRSTKDDPWGVPMNLGPVVNSSANDEHPRLSADSLSLYFSSTREGGSGAFDLWVTTRQTKDSPWNDPVNLGSTVNSKYSEGNPSISSDGLSLYFSDFQNFRPGGYGMWDIYVTTRPTISDPWDIPVNLGSNVNSPGIDASPNISSDGLVLFLNSDLSGGFGFSDIWMTRRKKQDAEWEPLVNLGPTINRSGFEATPDISSDGSTLYFCSERPGGFGDVDLLQVSIEPVVDFNIDGIVDSKDMCFMVDHWGEDFPLCDIGPTPFGDGIVDVHDIVVLAEYLFKDIPESTLVAHWALDETEGMFAGDSVGGNDAVVLGGAIWQPSGGQVDGALQLDGASGYAITGFALNPADGPFSIFAWIKGGAPGQVILSQQLTSDWLGLDAEGRLMTELNSSDQLAGPLLSKIVITDGQWHYIGLVWHGSYRTLYVDGVAVAEDIQDGLESSENGLNIGAGKMTQTGTYFSGLIDDVRIYNRVLSP